MDNLDQLPETVKRNILARLLGPDDVSVPRVHSAGPAAAAAAGPQQEHQVPAESIRSRQVVVPAMEGGAAIVDGVLSLQEVQAVAAAVEEWLSQHGRRPGMGSSASGGLWHDTSFRGDINCWVTPAELQAAGQPLLAACLQMLLALQPQLSAQGFDVSGRFSCQLACYPGKGARYVRHADASASAPDRTVTALLYLNPEWDCQVDGGQLALYNAAYSRHNPLSTPPSASAAADGGPTSTEAGSSGAPPAGHLAGEPALLVAPSGGRLLVFDSRLPHEVLPAHKTRLSVTAWFYRSKEEHTSTTLAAAAAAAAGASSPAVAARGAVASPAATAAAQPCGHQHAPLHSPPPAAAPPGSPGTSAPPPASASTATAAAAAAASSCADAAAPAITAAASPPATSLPGIFVSIAAFRDEECQWTLRDLFTKAAHPERVHVGVVWQIDPVADAGFARMAGGSRTAQYLPQVREVRCHYSTAAGPCVARSMAQQLWSGEEYVLQVDAHMRFVQDWDTLCISELQAAQQAAGHAAVLLSTYPLGYDGHGAAAAVPSSAPATLLCAKEFDACGVLRVQARALTRERPPGPLLSSFWAAGFSFAPAAWLLDVPYCPHLPHLFFGEEQYMLLRMWTRGWDVYAPSEAVAFHQWERKARANSYQACVKIDAAARAASQERVLSVVAAAVGAAAAPDQQPPAGPASTLWHSSQPPAQADWGLGGIWGLGTSRSVQQYEQQAGVSFAHKTLEQRALWGGQPEDAFAV